MRLLAKNIFLVSLLIFLFAQCNRERPQRAFYPPVNTFINISLIQYNALQVPGGWAYVNAGNQGIIVYARGGGEYVAFDRNCTFNEENPCGRAEVNADNVTIDCACDGSTYNIFDGSVTNGPAEFPLFQYQTSFEPSTNQLRIFS